MAFAKSFLELSPLLSLALAVALSFWAMTMPPAQAYNHALRFGPNQDNPTDVLGYGCGYYNTGDPGQDAGIAHQPCYGGDGSIQFCCLSGSSKCSCPLVSGSDLGCYNHEAGNSLNANTGEECGHFLPDLVGADYARRQLRGDPCNCPDPDECGKTLTAQTPFLPNGFTCTYASPIAAVCIYNGTGTLIGSDGPCCFPTATCGS